jgi:ribonuclease P protein component
MAVNVGDSDKGKMKFQAIKGEKTFSAIFKRSKKFVGDGAYCYFVFKRIKPNESNNALNFAVIVKKRCIKKASARNRAKRLLREAIRNEFSRRGFSEFVDSIAYLVFFWGEPIDKPKLLRYDRVSNSVSDLIDKAEIFYYEKLKGDASEKVNNLSN